MKAYIDREKLIERLHNAEENYKADHDYEVDDDPFSDGILSAMFSVNQIVGTEPTADVIERSKVNKAIEELQNMKVYGRTRTARLVSLPEVLDVLKRNIGE